jgi:hypothetical protein
VFGRRKNERALDRANAIVGWHASIKLLLGHAIVLTTVGTLGDVRPLIGVALEMRRGHTPVLAVPRSFVRRLSL